MRLSQLFHEISLKPFQQEVSLFELISSVGARSKVLIPLICTIPFLLFLPIPGLSTLLGLLILFCSFSILLNRPIGFSKWILRKKISEKSARQIFIKGEKILLKIEKIARPRGEFLAKHPILEKVHGILILISSLFLILPLPPGTNFTPSLSIFLLSIGMLEEDCLFLVVGYLAFLINLIFFGILLFGILFL